MNPQQNNIYSGMGSEMTMKNVPSVYGGMTVNYMASSKWNVNLNAYYLSKQTIYHSTYFLFNDGVRGVDHIKGKCIVNANVSYKLMDRLQVNANFKNVLNNTSREYYKTDEVPFMFLAGIHFQF
jgi:outer membrane receptor protein involved in Fe transport